MNAIADGDTSRRTRRRPPAASPTWSRPAPACSTSAAATARCWRSCATQRGVDGRGIELSQRGRQRLRRQGTVGDPGRRRHRSRRLSRRRLRLCDPVADASRRRASPQVVLEHMLRIGRRAIVSFPNFGHWRVRARARCSTGACRSPTTCPIPGTTRRTSISARSATSSSSARKWAPTWSAGSPRRPRQAGPHGPAVVGLEHARRARRVPAEAALIFRASGLMLARRVSRRRQGMQIPHHALQALVEHVRVDLGRRDVGMAEQFLHHPEIRAVLEQVAREGMTQHVRATLSARNPAAAATTLRSRAKACRVRWPLSLSAGNSHGPGRLSLLFEQRQIFPRPVAGLPRSGAPVAPWRPCRAPPETVRGSWRRCVAAR